MDIYDDLTGELSPAKLARYDILMRMTTPAIPFAKLKWDTLDDARRRPGKCASA